MSRSSSSRRFGLLILLIAAALTGCGTTRQRRATEQLLLSDAVDRAVSELDFSPLAGYRVALDTRYLTTVDGVGFVNANYVISSLRQQMLAAGVRLEDKPDDAQIVVEPRVGTLGLDSHEVIYGIPANAGLSTVSSLVPSAPQLPVMPEVALAKREGSKAAAKIGVFAYDRETREAVWQSGLSLSGSDARDTWLFGAGPFQEGAIYDGPRFAGNRLRLPLLDDAEEEQVRPHTASYFEEADFQRYRQLVQRRHQQLLEEFDRLTEVPELLPLTQHRFGNASVTRRLPPIELDSGEATEEDADPETESSEEASDSAESDASAESTGTSEEAGAEGGVETAA